MPVDARGLLDVAEWESTARDDTPAARADRRGVAVGQHAVTASDAEVATE
ncbi:hypothetical protein AB0N64_02210 [Microbacterium sp. NPDC089318]